MIIYLKDHTTLLGPILILSIHSLIHRHATITSTHLANLTGASIPIDHATSASIHHDHATITSTFLDHSTIVPRLITRAIVGPTTQSNSKELRNS